MHMRFPDVSGQDMRGVGGSGTISMRHSMTRVPSTSSVTPANCSLISGKGSMRP